MGYITYSFPRSQSIWNNEYFILLAYDSKTGKNENLKRKQTNR